MRRTTAGLVIAAVGACLEPLPEPEPCDDADQFISESGACESCLEPDELVNGRCLACPVSGSTVTQCFPQAGTFTTMSGCIAAGADYDPFECLTGRVGAEATEECTIPLPASALDACFAPREGEDPRCPPEVSALGDATCFPLAPADISVLAGASLEACMCRTPDRLARCDGVGVIVASVAHASDPRAVAMAPLVITPPADLPEAGRLGVYVRVRGFAAPFVVQSVNPADFETLAAWAFFVTKGYDALVGFGSEQDGIPIFGDLQAGLVYGPGVGPKPELLVISLQEIVGGVEQLVSVIELDCLIPFVIDDPGPP